MLPWAPGTAAGGSWGERAERQRALIAPEHAQGQPQTPHSLEGLAQTPQPWGSSPLPSGSLPTSCDGTWREQLSHCLTHSTAQPCLPIEWKGQEGSPSFGKCKDHDYQPPKVRTSALHNTHVTVLHCPQQVPLLTSTCSLPLLPLPTLTVRADLQQKCHVKPPGSCRPHAWPLTTQKRTGQVCSCQPCWFPPFPRVQLL